MSATLAVLKLQANVCSLQRRHSFLNLDPFVMTPRTATRTKRQSTHLELRVQEFARNRAAKQLLRVPSNEFRIAHKKYIQWRAFALWVRAVVESERRVSPLVRDALKRRCPDFLNNEPQIANSTLLGLHLDEWIHERVFGYAKRDGWLDALLFYGARDPRSQCVMAYWERCEKEWREKRPSRYPRFRNWSNSAARYALFPKVNADRLAGAVESCVDWMGFAYWLQPLLDDGQEPPAHVLKEVQRRLPGFLEATNRFAAKPKETSSTAESQLVRWSELIRWIESHCFSDAKEQGWFGLVFRHLRNHPRHVRIAEYSVLWREGRSWKSRAYPSFVRWRRVAENFSEGHRANSKRMPISSS